jgi:fatty acid desaturase
MALAMLFLPHLPGLAFLSEESILAILWIFCTSLLCFIASIINHNHMHCRIFRNNTHNVLLNLALSITRGHTATGIVIPHQLNHHIEAGSDRDWIRPSLSGYGIGWRRLPRYVVFASINMMIKRTKPAAPVLPGQRLRSLRIEKAFLFAAIALAAVHDWHVFLLFNALPWLLGLSLLVAVNLLQHDDCSPAELRGESRDFTGTLGNWLFFNNGFHTVHHWCPAAHWSKLPALHLELQAQFSYAHQSHRSIMAYLWQFLWSRKPFISKK